MSVRLVSIIVCTHNRADLLSCIIDQLRAQNYPADSFEIIIIDNNSTDQTRQVVEEYITKPGAPVRYVFEGRSGITFVRNRGAEESHYPYLAYVDDDCRVGSDWLSQLVRGFDLQENVGAIGGRVTLDWGQQERPKWLGSGFEPWLAENSRLGYQPRLLDKKNQIMEGNMAISREAWHLAGGFLGMEQFGSRNMSAGEVLYMLYQLRKSGYQVAFVPQAVAMHRMGIYTRCRFLHRAYWQGVSDGILDYLIYRRSWLATIARIILDFAAMIVLFGCASLFYLAAREDRGMIYLVRAVRRFSLILSEARLAGNWHCVRTWISAHDSIEQSQAGLPAKI